MTTATSEQRLETAKEIQVWLIEQTIQNGGKIKSFEGLFGHFLVNSTTLNSSYLKNSFFHEYAHLVRYLRYRDWYNDGQKIVATVDEQAEYRKTQIGMCDAKPPEKEIEKPITIAVNRDLLKNIYDILDSDGLSNNLVVLEADHLMTFSYVKNGLKKLLGK